MLNPNSKTLAIDFDGTIVEHKFPRIGKELPFAIQTLKQLQEDGFQLILWTYRSGKELQEAVDFCAERGLEFFAVNTNYPEGVPSGNHSPKILADIYIDDRNLGGFPGWGITYQILTEGKDTFLEQHWERVKTDGSQKKSRPSFLKNIFGK